MFHTDIQGVFVDRTSLNQTLKKIRWQVYCTVWFKCCVNFQRIINSLNHLLTEDTRFAASFSPGGFVRAGPGLDLDFGPIFLAGLSSNLMVTLTFSTSGDFGSSFLVAGPGFRLLAGPAFRPAGPGFLPRSIFFGLSLSESFLSDSSGFSGSFAWTSAKCLEWASSPTKIFPQNPQ